MADEVRIGIITRLRNTNAGNEALSTELIQLAGRLIPNLRAMAVDRYPRYLEHLKIDSLGYSSTLSNFDSLAKRLADKFFRADIPLPSTVSSNTVTLNLTGKELGPAISRVKNFIGVRRNLARFGLIESHQAFETVSMCGRVNLVVWNPAGEFHPTGSRDGTFRLLLLMRIAQQLGVRTAIVNHSLEVSDDLLRHVVGHVYRHASHICVRDGQSLAVVRSLGVEPHRVSEAPDLAFLASLRSASPQTVEEVQPGTIGIAINAAEATQGSDEWDALLDNLKTLGKPLVFVSNAMNGDMEFGRRLMWRHGGTLIARQPTYLELRELYRKMDVVISSRLHASVLSLCSGTPVVTLEPSVFKLSAIMEQLNYPIATDRLTTPGWSQRVIDNVRLALNQRELLKASALKMLRRQTDSIHKVYGSIFQLAILGTEA